MSATMNVVDLNDLLNTDDLWDVPEEQMRSKGDFGLIPAGTYNVRVVKVEQRTSSNGNPSLNFHLQITDGEFENRYVFYRLMLIPSWQGSIVQTWAALGKEEGDSTYMPGEFDGAVCRAKVRIRPAENGYPEQNTVDRILPPTEEQEADWLS